jgi:hypothetical protein
MEDGCSSLSRKTAQREEAGLAPSESFSVPAEGPRAELVSDACKAAREDGPGIAGGDALATGYATAEPQACKQARESFGRAASGVPSQRVTVRLHLRLGRLDGSVSWSQRGSVQDFRN